MQEVTGNVAPRTLIFALIFKGKKNILHRVLGFRFHFIDSVEPGPEVFKRKRELRKKYRYIVEANWKTSSGSQKTRIALYGITNEAIYHHPEVEATWSLISKR
jgi:hypothetical protein